MHPLVANVYRASRGTTLRALLRGLALPFRAARFLLSHRPLWPFAIAPVLIHGALLAGAAVFVLAYADAAAAWIWAPPSGTTLWSAALLALWYVLYLLVLAFGLVTAYATTLLVSGVVASPFNDVLSARAEALLRSDGPAPAGERPLWREALYSLRSTALVLALYLALMGPVLLLNVVPGLGSMAATGLGTGVSAFFLTLEFADITLARYGYRLRQKLRLLRAHPGLTAGFGLSTSLLLWIPVLNLLCVPIAVVGGTALALALIHDSEPPRAGTP